jgi:hypothetical protein
MGGDNASSSLSDGLFALPYTHPSSAASTNLHPRPEPGPPLEHGWEHLLYLRVPAIYSTVVPSHQRPMLADHDRLPHEPLDNMIHPLFKFDNWQGLPREKYELLLPALRIATEFMEQRSLLHFWKHILFGELKYDTGTEEWYLAPGPRENWPKSDEDTHIYLTQTIPRVLRLCFRHCPHDAFSFGNEARYQEFCKGVQLQDYPVFDFPRIMLHTHYLYDVEYLSTHGSEDDKHNIYLRLAITLCHELAHITWKYRMKGDYPEPLYEQGDTCAELGRAWEYNILGGVIWTLDHPGYFTTYYRPGGIRKGRESLDARVVVPRWWINMWSRKSTWRCFWHLHPADQLRLPTGHEIGYVYQENNAVDGSTWTLWHYHTPRAFNCIMPKDAPNLIWNLVRPRLQAVLMQEERAARKKARASFFKRRIERARKIWGELREHSSTWNRIRGAISPQPQFRGRRAASI